MKNNYLFKSLFVISTFMLSFFYSTQLNAQCSTGQVQLVLSVDVTNDLYPDETGWKLFDVTADTVVDSLCFGTYTSTSGVVTYTFCVTSGSDYKLYALDDFGDGMDGAVLSLAYSWGSQVGSIGGFTNYNIAYPHCNPAYANNEIADTLQFTAANLPPCLTGTIDSARNVTTSSAELFFTENFGSLVNFQYGPSGFTLGQGIMINNYDATNDSVVLSGLFPNQSYDVYIQDSCVNNGLGNWSAAFTFTTSFAGPPTFLIENWELGTTGWTLGNSGPYWSRRNTQTGSSNTGPFGGSVSGTPTSGNYYVYLETSTGSGQADLTYNSTLDLSSFANPQFSFWYHMYGAAMGSLELYLDTNNSGVYYNAWSISGQQHTSVNDPYTKVTLSLPSTVDTLAFKFTGVRGTSFTSDMAVDDISYGDMPSCPKPSVSVVSNNFTSAIIDVTASNDSVLTLEYGPVGFAPGTGTTVSATTGNNTITGLTTNEYFDVYVYGYCNGNEAMQLSSVGTFNTIVGTACGTADIVTSLPYFKDSLNTDGFGDDYSSADACNSVYMNGDDYVFVYNAATTNLAEVVLTNTGTYVGVFVTDACPDDPNAVCVAQATTSGSNPTIPQVLFEAGKTYYITVSTYPAPQSTPFDIAINVLPNEVSINSIDNPVNPVSAGFASVEVNISNNGGSAINSVSFGYSKNGVTQAPATVALNNLLTGDDTTVTIGGTNFPTTPTDITAYITGVMGSLDNNQSNDTVSTRFCGPISGTFTVGGAGATFATLGQAVEALDCGINGPVTFNIAPGTYNEAISIPQVFGASAINTITFDGGSASTTTITWNSNIDVPTVELNGADYVTLTNLTIEATWTSTDNWCVFLRNDANWNTIENCNLTIPNTTTTSDRAGIAISNNRFGISTAYSGNNASHLTIKNNTITGGYYGIAFIGAGSSTTIPRNTGVVIENNDISVNYSGVYLYGVDSANVKGNNIEVSGGLTTKYAVYLAYGAGHVFEANSILSNDHGIYMFNSTASPNADYRFVNNMIATSNDEGVYMSTIRNATFLHNSILGDPGLYMTNGNTNGLNVQNNIFASQNGYAFESNSADSASFSNLDYNLYFSQASPALEMGNTSYGSLLAWQNAYPYFNANSVEGDPLFNSNTDLHITLGILADSAGTPVGIIKDIDGDGRYFLAPDIGADEYTPITSDLELLSDVSFNICKNGSDSITFYIVNKAQSQIDFSNDNFTLNVNVSGAASSTASINVNSGIVNPSDTFSIVASPIILNVEGSYNIDAYLSSTWDIVNDNDSLFGATYDEVFPISLSPDTVVQIINATQTVDLKASSIFSAPAMFNITERCNFAGASTGAPVGGKPSWMAADDYVEISGAPNSDIGGYTYELWTGTSIRISYTFPAGTFLSPNGTLILGTFSSGSASPSNFYYVTSTQSSTSSSTANGNILKDPNGNIIDAVGYNSYNFPAASGVTSADWSGNLSGGGSTWGIRLQGPDLNGPTGWSVSSNTNRQDPNVYNTGFPAISLASSYPVSWSLNSTLIDSVNDITVGPFTVADNGLKAYVFELNGPCGTVYDTAYVNVNIIPDEVSVNQILEPQGGCNIDTTFIVAQICNNGANGYQNIPVYANVDGTLFTDTLDTLAPYSCQTFTMSAAPISILSSDTTLNNITVYVAVTGDVDVTNDTNSVGPIVFTSPPTPPTTSNDTVCAGESAILVANSTVLVEWYDSPTGGNYLGTGDTLLLSVSANDTVYAQSGSIQIFPLPTNYCLSAGPLSTADSDIQSVYLAGESDTINNPNTCPSSPGVVNFTSQVASVYPGNSYTLEVQFGTCGGNYGSAGQAWIDWNSNGVFESSESVGTWQGTPPAALSVFNFTVPGSALTGSNVRMRVMQQEGGSIPLNPCGSFNWGNVEDYTISILDPNPCYNTQRTVAYVYYNGITIDSTLSADQSNCLLTDGTIDVYASDDNSSVGGALQYSIDGGTTFQSSSSFTGLANNAIGYDVVVTDGFCTLNGPNLVINKPGAPQAPVMPSAFTYCEGETLMPLFIDSAGLDSGVTQVKWYTDPTLNPVSQIGVDTILPADTTATITYYATQVLAGCEGVAGSVDVTVIPQPLAPIVSPDSTVCYGANLDITANVPGFIPTTYFEDFESGTGGWTLGNAGPNWQRRNTQTGSSSTGPFGGSVNGVPTSGNYYVYLETSTTAGNADLTGPGFNLQPNSILEFDYHMYGATMGTLTVEVFDGSSWTAVWSISGQQHTSVNDPYTTAVISLAGYSGPSNIRFNGLRGGSFTGDMAVDNIKVYNTQPQAIWAFDNQFVNVLDTATTISALDSVGALTYYARYLDGTSGCISDYDSVTVTKLTAPVAPTVASQVFCDGDSITPLPITGSGGTYNVYGDMMLNNQITSGVSSYTTSLTGPGYADYYVTEVNAIGCESPAGMASVTINAVPTSANLGADKNYCQGDSILPLSAGSIPGTTLNWYSDAAGTTLIGTGSYQPANSVGTTTYYASLSNGLCSGPIDSVQVTINAIPGTPTAAGGATYCDGDALAALTATGSATSFSWYTDAALTNMVGSGASFTPANIVDTVTYYVTQDANGCESAGADSVTVIINGNPSITLVTSDSASACNTSDGWIEITAAGGDGVYSYSVNGGTSTTANDSITGLAPGNYTPYVVDGNGCSDVASVVTINAPGQPLQPSVVAGNNGVYCQGDAYAALEVVDTISGQTFNWYYDAALTSLYMTGDSVMPADSVGILTYYVTANASGCQGPSATATVTINPIPVAPTGGNDLTYCLGQPVGNVSGTPNSGGTLSWYTDNSLTTLIGFGNSVAAGGVAVLPGTYSFYVTETVSGCESGYDSVNVTINPIPNTPNAGMDMVYCDGDMIMPLVATGAGGTYNWYSNAQLTNNVGTGDSLSFTSLPIGANTYWLAETNSFGCEGNSDNVTITVNPTPMMPMIVGASDYCEYETVGTLMAMGTGGVYDWSDMNGVVAADTNMYITSNAIGMYEVYVTETNQIGCTSEADTAVVNVFQRPAIASTSVINAFGGCADSTGSIEINAIDGDGNYTYYGKIFGSLLNNGSDSVFANLPAGTYDSLLVVDGNGCFSGTDIASISSPTKPAQLALISGGGSFCDGEPVLDLVVQDSSVSTNGTIEWYADSTLQSLIFASDTLSPSTAVGNYTYYAVENNFGCKSDPQQVSVVINALPSTPITSDDTTYCDGETIADITVSGGNGTFTWYSDAALTTVFSQGSSTVTPSITTPGQEILYVTETDGNGCTSSADSVLVVVNPSPATPSIVGDLTVCSNYNTVNTSYYGNGASYGYLKAVGNGGQFDWSIAVQGGSTLHQTGDSIAIPSAVGIYSAKVVETNSFGCLSDTSVNIAVTVLDVPTLDSIIVTDVTGGCFDSTGSFEVFASNGSTGSSLTYEAIIYGNRILNGSNSTFNNLPAGTYDSVLVQDNNGCYSNFTTASLSAPGQPSALEAISNDTLYCFGDPINAISVVDTSLSTSGTIEWYSDASLTNNIGTGSSITPDSSVGIKNYYAVENNNGCRGPSVAIQVTVTALPATPNTSGNVQYCDGDAINDIYAISAGGTITWYSDAALTNVFATGDTTTPSITTPGQEVLYVVETDTNGCTSAIANDILITVDTLPTVMTSPLADVCENGGTVQLMGAMPMGGTWSADSGVTNGVLDPIAIGGVGTYTVTYTYTDGKGCSASDTESITVNAPPVVSFTGLSNLCLDASSFVLTGGNPVGGVYSGNGVDSSGSFNPFVAGVGSKILSYTYTDNNNCSNTDTDTLSVFSLPNVSIAPLPAICENGGTVNLLGGSPLGGTWSADSGLTSGGILDPIAIGGAGTYDVRYSYTDGNGCTSVDTTSLLINPEPTVSFTGIQDVCLNNGVVDLTTFTNIGGGTFSGSGVVGNDFDPILSGSGLVTLNYTFTDSITACSSADSDTIEVFSLPQANAGADQSLCMGDTLLLIASGGQSYNWSNGANNDSTSVSPLVDTMYVVTVTDLNNCSLSDTISITIDTLPTVTLAPLADVCENAGVIGLMGGMPMGGTWSADSGVTAGGVIDPVAIGGAGTYNVTYTFTDGNGCTSDDVQSLTINPEPVVTFSGLANVCFDQASSTLSGGLPLGGNYSGNGVVGGAFSAATAGVGTHVITYNYTDANSCSSTNTDTIQVYALPNANAGVDQTICFGDSVTLTATGGTTYSWSNGAGNASQSVSPATTTNYGVLVTDVNGCTNTDSVMVNVNQLPTVSIGSINSVCDGAAPVALLTGTPANGTYSGTGVGGGVFNPSVGAGSYVITYSFTDGNNCSNSATTTLVVDTLPTVTFATPANICDGSAATNLTGGLPAGGTYSGTGVTGSQFDPVTAGGAGTYNLSYSFTDGNGCANSVTSTITVDTLPTITWTAFNDICDNAPAITLSEAAPAGGSYSGTGVAGGQFDPTAAGGAGNYTITYNYTDGNGCSSSDDQSITVNPSPVVDLGGDTTLCNNIPTVTLDAGPGASYVWSLDGLTLSNTTQTIIVDGATGSGTYTVVVTNAFGCEGEDEVVVDFTEICASVNTTFADNVSVTYYPNPTTGMLNVDITGLVGEDITLTVTNMHGQQVFNTFIENAPSNLRDVIDISTEASGIYFIKLTSGDKSFVERISLR